MRLYWLRLHPESALHLNDPTTITARTLRGAIGAAALHGCVPGARHEAGLCSAGCRYWPLFGFGRGLIRVGDAHATTEDAVLSFPTTAQTCSVKPGFKASGGHGVLDTAIRAWTFEGAMDVPARLMIPFEAGCIVCGAPLTPIAGHYLRNGSDFTRIADLTTPALTEHRPVSRALRRGLGSFTQSGSVLTKGAYYVAKIAVPDESDTLLRGVLAEGLLIGGRRTRGMGACRVELIPRPDPAQTLRERIAAFNRALRMERRFYGAMHTESLLPDDGSWYFTLDFNMQPNTARGPSPLADARGLRSITILRYWLRPSIAGGRSLATGLPAALALTLHGTALCEAPSDGDRVALEEALIYLEAHGIGLERARDGEVTVCDPFHGEVDPI